MLIAWANFLAQVLIYIPTSNVLKQLVYAVHYQVKVHLGRLESTQEARLALSYRLEELLCFFRAFQTSHIQHNSIVHTKAWTNNIYLGLRHIHYTDLQLHFNLWEISIPPLESQGVADCTEARFWLLDEPWRTVIPVLSCEWSPWYAPAWRQTLSTSPQDHWMRSARG